MDVIAVVLLLYTCRYKRGDLIRGESVFVRDEHWTSGSERTRFLLATSGCRAMVLRLHGHILPSLRVGIVSATAVKRVDQREAVELGRVPNHCWIVCA